MNKRFPLYLILSMMLGFIAISCNDDKEDEELLDDPYRNSLIVSTFSLEKNDSVLVGLDSVFFSIDLDRAVIFNADSLPKGTKVNRLKVAMTLSSVAVAEVTMPNDQGADTVINFLTNASDSLNFSRGFVKLHLESANKEYKRDYTIYVNVHKTEPDSLSWGKNAWAALPTTLARPTAQHTVEYQGRALCFTTDGSAYSLAISDKPETGVWQKSSVTLPAGARIESITASADRLYLLTADGALWQSADDGDSWTSTGATMNHIYGCMNGTVYGNRLTSGGYVFTTFPASTESAVPADCPVSGTSSSMTFSTEWSTESMMLTMGGITASGKYTGDTWACDGSQWAAISVDPAPAASGMMMVPYFAFKTGTDWVVTKSSILLAFGGEKADKTLSRDIYLSYDRGVHWTKAPQLMQLPAGFTPGEGAQALVFDSKMPASAPAWNENTPVSLPAWYLPVTQQPQSRAVKPITSWDCPYIYVFGGNRADGSLNPTVWRGVITRLLFKPLQ